MTRPMKRYTDQELIRMTAALPAGDALRCPLRACEERFEVPPVPISDALGSVFGMSGDTLARIHGEQMVKNATNALRAHLRSHPFDDWLEDLVQTREWLAEAEHWARIGSTVGDPD